MALRCRRVSQFATLPSRGSLGAAGYDLSAAYDAVVPARGKALIKTDIELAIPSGHYGRVGETRARARARRADPPRAPPDRPARPHAPQRRARGWRGSTRSAWARA